MLGVIFCYIWQYITTHIPDSKIHGANMGSGADRTQVGPMLAPWTLLSGIMLSELLAKFLICVWNTNINMFEMWDFLTHQSLLVLWLSLVTLPLDQSAVSSSWTQPQCQLIHFQPLFHQHPSQFQIRTDNNLCALCKIKILKFSLSSILISWALTVLLNEKWYICIYCSDFFIDTVSVTHSGFKAGS